MSAASQWVKKNRLAVAASQWVKKNRLAVAAFGLALVVFSATAGAQLLRRSSDPHFVLQANAWLNGQLHIDTWPTGADDPAKVETVELDDGSRVRGRRIADRRVFRSTTGSEVSLSRVKKTIKTTHYVSFPPFPAVLMLPQAAIRGQAANDVALTAVLAALAPMLFLLLLGRLREEGLSTRTAREDAWFAALLCFGTVFYFSAVQGRVWFTAHIVAVDLCILYAHFSLGGRRPLLAGLFLGLAFVTRAPMLFMFPLFVLEAWRVAGGDRRAFAKRLALFAAPVAVIGMMAAWHNFMRFDQLTEFGHSYLAVRQKSQIDKYGLFNINYLSRNLAVAFTLLPQITRKAPYLLISGHGLAMWFTTPALLLLLWPKHKGSLHRTLWITIVCVALWTLLYQNSGWLQFGYRFALDYMVFLVMLLAIGGRPLSRWFRGLIVLGVLINLFGAVTFHRHNRFYKSDDATYRTVISH